ncbi:MAG: hypothetical protein P4M05_06945 [Bradyrhizobium sp.]|nr:hypothetical protein [Bradyrhizobium sp.]
MSGRRRRNSITGQFAWRLIEMLKSPAYRALSLSGRRILDRLEIELANHGGTQNGKLPVTYGDFERYGMDYGSIAGAIREVEALGFLEITERGRPSESDFGRHPSLYRITYRHGPHDEQPTNEWKRHGSQEQAQRVAKMARAAKNESAVAKGKLRASKNSGAGGGNFRSSGGENHPVTSVRPGWENPLTVPGGKNQPTLDISSEGEAA